MTRQGAALALALLGGLALGQPAGQPLGQPAGQPAPVTTAPLSAPAEGARTVEIVEAERLELRRLDGQELIVISGNPARLRVGDDEVSAERVEYNRASRTLTLLGGAQFRTFEVGPGGTRTPQLLTGEALVVNLGNQNLGGEDVIVSSGGLEIRGEEVQRVPGQLQASGGYVTPCAGCGQTPNDYAFRTGALTLYPGDRLVARDVTVLLADQPVFYLPVLVVFLGEENRRPRLEIGRSDADGRTIEADLPFVIGSVAAGNALLRYYQNRSPSLGFGVDLSTLSLGRAVDRLDLRALATPRPVGQSGYNVDIDSALRGVVPAQGSDNGVDYRVSAVRRDTGRTEAERGVTILSGTAQGSWDGFRVRLDYLQRLGPPPPGRLSEVQRTPEISVTPPEYRAGGFSVSGRAALGVFTAATNDISVLARERDNLTAARAELAFRAGYNTTPWTGATLTAQADYLGRLYSTTTNGAATRVVDYSFGARLTQNLGWLTAFASYDYFRREGTSPFQFDRLGGQRLEAIAAVGATVTPTEGLSFTVGQRYNFMLPAGEQAAATFGLNVNRDPLNVQASFNRNLFTGLPESSSLNVTLGSPTVGALFGLQLGASQQGFTPAALRLEYRASPTDNVGLRATYDFARGQWTVLTATLNATSGVDAVLNPVSMAVTQNVFLDTPRVSGTATLRWRGLEAELVHDLPLAAAPPATVPPAGNLTFAVGTLRGAETNWRLGYGGAYRALGPETGFLSPTLRGQFASAQGFRRVSAEFDYVFPGTDENATLGLTRAAAGLNWEFGGRVGVSGNASYSRSGGVLSPLQETLRLEPLNFTFALGDPNQPGGYLGVGFRQSFSWVGGQPTAAHVIRPIITLIADRCCWSLRAELNPVDGVARFSINLPGGSGPTLEATPAGTRFPGLFSNP